MRITQALAADAKSRAAEAQRYVSLIEKNL